MTRKRALKRMFVVFLLITLIGSDVYRPFIWAHKINDYGLADSCTNISGTMAASFLFIAFKNGAQEMNAIQIIIETVVGFIVYEFIQMALPWGTFDWKDIVGSIIGGTLAICIIKLPYFNDKTRE